MSSIEARMTYLDEGVVQDEHDRSKIPSPGFTPEKHLTNIANISHLRMAQAKLPHNQRSVQDESGNDHCQDQTWYKPQYGVRVRE